LKIRLIKDDLLPELEPQTLGELAEREMDYSFGDTDERGRSSAHLEKYIDLA
jgi:hypothetical protein